MSWTKARKKEPRLTERDMQVPELLEDYRVLTTSQLQRLLYPSLQKAQTRLLRLYQAGLVKRFSYPVLLREGGKGEYVYHLKKRPNTVLTALRHMLLLNDVRIAFELACKDSEQVNLVEFIPEYRGMRRDDGRPGRAVEDSVAVREGYGEQAILIPDAVVCLENTKTGKRALFFLEVDLGSEKLIGSGLARGYALLKKMLLYRSYQHSRGFQRYNDLFRFKFKGFRVLTIMNNPKRTARLRAELRQNGIHKIIWFAQDTEINQTILLDKIWLVPDAEDNERHSILHG